eukprot:jgi/Picsp_1/646/NSC_00642-R1_protein
MLTISRQSRTIAGGVGSAHRCTLRPGASLRTSVSYGFGSPSTSFINNTNLKYELRPVRMGSEGGVPALDIPCPTGGFLVWDQYGLYRVKRGGVSARASMAGDIGAEEDAGRIACSKVIAALQNLPPRSSAGNTGTRQEQDNYEPLPGKSESNGRAAAHAIKSYCSKAAEKGKKTLPLLLGAIPMAVIPQGVWDQLAGNYVFVVGFWGWFLAQFFKIFTKWYKTGVLSPMAFFDSGGMPSSHSSLCSAVTTAVAIHHGLGSSLFAVCTCFSVIVMYDAMGVRRHAGLQAQVLNAVVDDLLEGHPVSERKLKEVLGHTPRQVMCGAILGLLVGLMYPHPVVLSV